MQFEKSTERFKLGGYQFSSKFKKKKKIQVGFTSRSTIFTGYETKKLKFHTPRTNVQTHSNVSDNSKLTSTPEASGMTVQDKGYFRKSFYPKPNYKMISRPTSK